MISSLHGHNWLQRPKVDNFMFAGKNLLKTLKRIISCLQGQNWMQRPKKVILCLQGQNCSLWPKMDNFMVKRPKSVAMAKNE